MGSPLAPALANISMTDLKSTIIRTFFDTGKKIYCPYIDVTPLLIKPEDI